MKYSEIKSWTRNS